MKKPVFKVLILVVAAFVVYNLISFFAGGESSVIAELETMEKSYKFDGIIIRDEKLITLNTKDGGILDIFVNENEMVRKGKHVATYYDSDIDEGTKSELAKINEEISKLNNSTEENIVSNMSQREMEEEIDSMIHSLALAAPERNIAVVAGIKSEINELIAKGESGGGTDMTVSDRLDELMAKKREIEKRYSGNKYEVTAPKHGVFSTRLDGFEEELVPELALNIAVSDYKNAKSKKVTAKDIKELGALCKIVDNSLWYMSVEADEATAKAFAVGEKINIRFDSEINDAKGTVEYISLNEQGKYMITISSSSYCNYAMENRFAKATLVKEINTGLKIPLKAIKVKDGKSGVYVKTENTLKYKEIEIISKDETHAIVKFDNTRSNGLLLYDEVVVKE